MTTNPSAGNTSAVGGGIRLGLCSVTFRALEPEAVIAAAARAHLNAIEWGADVHVPVGDLVRAREIRDRTNDAGIAVSSYGSYLSLGTSSPAEHETVIDTALALGAPRIRVWAGRQGSDQATAQERGQVVGDAQTFADRAAEAGLTVGLEFHGGSLTDSVESTLALLESIDRPDTVRTYWQPPVGEPDGQALNGLSRVREHVEAIHAFSWWPREQRRPLAARAALWGSVPASLGERQRPIDVLFEFVADDSETQLVEDAAAMRDLIVRPLRSTHEGEPYGTRRPA